MGINPHRMVVIFRSSFVLRGYSIMLVTSRAEQILRAMLQNML